MAAQFIPLIFGAAATGARYVANKLAKDLTKKGIARKGTDFQVKNKNPINSVDDLPSSIAKKLEPKPTETVAARTNRVRKQVREAEGTPAKKPPRVRTRRNLTDSDRSKVRQEMRDVNRRIGQAKKDAAREQGKMMYGGKVKTKSYAKGGGVRKVRG